MRTITVLFPFFAKFASEVSNTIWDQSRRHTGVLIQGKAVWDASDVDPPEGQPFINFLLPYRYREPWHFDHGINIHPAPPQYPGVGVATRALLDNAKEFGITVHRLAAEYDSGRILCVDRFEVRPGISCNHLFWQAEHAAVSLLPYIIGKVVKHGADWPDECSEQWGEYVDRSTFMAMITAHVDGKSDYIDAIVRAARHPSKPGPFVRIGPHKFGYVHE